MQLKSFLLGLCLASTAVAAPLSRASHPLYNIDGEEIPDQKWPVDKKGNIIFPDDWPTYDSFEYKCPAHKNYVPRLMINTWEDECLPSKFLLMPMRESQIFVIRRLTLTIATEVQKWKVDHKMFESQEAAAWAKDNEERRRKDMLRACAPKPCSPECREFTAQECERNRKKQEQEQKSPQLSKRTVYNIDGEAMPDPAWARGPWDKVKYPADWPTYDSNDKPCEAHQNYVTPSKHNKWADECVQSKSPPYRAERNARASDEPVLMVTPTELDSWKENNNIFGTRKEAAAAKDRKERRRKLMRENCLSGAWSKMPHPLFDWMCKKYLEGQKAEGDAEKPKQEGEGSGADGAEMLS